MKLFRSIRNMLTRHTALALGLLSLALVVHEIFAANGWLAMRRKRQQARALQQKIEQLKQQRTELEQNIQGLKSNPQVIEKTAREELHLAKPGEIIYTLPPQKK